MSLIQFEQVHKNYRIGSSIVHAVRDLNLTIGEGEFVALSGPSGSGKSTVFSLMAGMSAPSAGRVIIDGTDISQFTGNDSALLRRRLFGFVFQSFNLMPNLNAYENIELPMLVMPLSAGERRQRVAEIVERLEIGDLLRHRPAELSGGQKQRVAIARALINKPRIIIADEPTANLDSRTGRLVLELAKERCRIDRVTFLFSSHDAAMVAEAGRVIHLCDGTVAAPAQERLAAAG